MNESNTRNHAQVEAIVPKTKPTEISNMDGGKSDSNSEHEQGEGLQTNFTTIMNQINQKHQLQPKIRTQS